ncbi:MAG: hypothetical protein ACJARJ_002411 [Neptuniibacter pectenicola]|jgi:hypothetical protein
MIDYSHVFSARKILSPVTPSNHCAMATIERDSEQRSQHTFYQIDQLLSFKKSVAMIIKKYRQEP